MFSLLVTTVAASMQPLVLFVVVAVIIAVLLYYIPRVLPLDAGVWTIIRVVVIIALILWALRLFGIL